MIEQSPLVAIEKRLLVFGGLLLIFAFYYNLGIYPLFLEEPRRALIALEMLLNDNIWVPTQAGDLYYRKPPVYNWMIIISYKLFGEANEFAVRFFSVSSHLVSGLLVYLFVRRYVNPQVAIFSAFGFLVAADILTYFSALGEIDLFYALITSLSIFLIYFFGRRQSYWWLFSLVYLLTAIGFLTKGLTSLPFTAISLLVYFIQEKNFKKLLSFQHILGICLFALITLGYFYQYGKFAAVEGWWTTLLSESTDKATAGGIGAFLSHLITFPIETIKILLPATLFLPLLFVKGGFKKVKSNHFIWFCFLIFVFNYPLYWFSTEAKSRYIYPLFPFATIMLTYLAMHISTKALLKGLKILTTIILSILLLALPASLFIDALDPVDDWLYSAIVFFVMVGSLAFLYFKGKVRAYLVVLLLFVVVKLVMSTTIPVIRAKTSDALADKDMAIKIAGITSGEELHRYDSLRISLGMVFYLEKERQEVLKSSDQLRSGYFFVEPTDLLNTESSYQLVEEFLYKSDTLLLIKLD